MLFFLRLPSFWSSNSGLFWLPLSFWRFAAYSPESPSILQNDTVILLQEIKNHPYSVSRMTCYPSEWCGCSSTRTSRTEYTGLQNGAFILQDDYIVLWNVGVWAEGSPVVVSQLTGAVLGATHNFTPLSGMASGKVEPGAGVVRAAAPPPPPPPAPWLSFSLPRLSVHCPGHNFLILWSPRQWGIIGLCSFPLNT